MAPSIEDFERTIGRGLVPGDILKIHGANWHEVTKSPSISPKHTGVRVPNTTGATYEGNVLRNLDLYEDITKIEDRGDLPPSKVPESPYYTGDGTSESPLRPRKGFRAFREAVGRDFTQRVWEGESVDLYVDGWTFRVKRMQEYPDEICVYLDGTERSPSGGFNISDLRTSAEMAQFIHTAFVNNFHR